MEIIDFHLHPGYDFHKRDHGVDIDTERFRRDLEDCGITSCCGSYISERMNGRPLEEYERIVPELNREVCKIKELYGDFFVPGIHIHPSFVEMSCREIEKYAKLGVKLIGELVPYMMSWKDCATKGFLEIMEVASQYGMTVNIHPTTYEDMHKLCDLVPKEINLVWAHFSGYGGYDEHIRMIKEHENVYFDTSAHGCDRVGIIKSAVEKIGSEKLLFGTDYPGIGPSSDIAAIMFEDITDRDRENIFSLNAKRRLGL